MYDKAVCVGLICWRLRALVREGCVERVGRAAGRAALWLSSTVGKLAMRPQEGTGVSVPLSLLSAFNSCILGGLERRYPRAPRGPE